MIANGQVKVAKASKSKRSKAGAVKRSPRLALALTVALGVGIPCLTLALSTIGGRLALSGHWALSAMALALTVSVLAVSLSHLAWAIEDITRSGRRASWALAVSVDVAVVMCELVTVFAVDAELATLAPGLMIALAVVSAALNVWAFLRHR